MSDNISAIETQSPVSAWSHLINIIDKPQQTFTNILAYPRLKWVLPLVLIILVTVINVAVSSSYSIALQEKAAISQLTEQGMSPAEIEDAMAMSAKFLTPAVFIPVGSISAIVMIAIMWVAASALFYFVSLVTGAEELKFGSVFNMMAWSTIPTTLRTLIMGIMIAVTGKFPVYTSLAILQSSGDVTKDATNPIYTLLSFADPFWFWHIFLLIVGLAVVTKFSRMKSAAIVSVYALLTIGLGVGLTMLGAGMGG